MDIGEFSEKSNKFCKVGGGGRVTYPGLASSIPWGGGGVAVLLVTSCYRNLDKFWLDGPIGFLPFFPQRTLTL